MEVGQNQAKSIFGGKPNFEHLKPIDYAEMSGFELATQTGSC